VPTSITTRETAGGGATVKDAPLTNVEIDNNFISIVDNKLEVDSDLSDLNSASTARTNLGVEIGTDVLGVSNNLSDLNSASTARTNLGVEIGTDVLGVSNNLSDLNNASTARSNLGLGSIAVQDASSVNITGGTISGDGSGLTSVDAFTLDGQSASYYLNFNNFTNTPTIGDAQVSITGGSGLSGSGSFNLNDTVTSSITVDHADTSTQTSVNNSGNTVIQDITLDGFGHITALSSKTIDPPTLDTLGLDTSDDVQFDSLGVGTPASGEIVATNDITAFFSDDRLKTRLGELTDALDKLSTLDAFYFEPNETAQDLGYEIIRNVGVSAQQVQKILPEVVVPAPIDDKYLTVKYEKMVPLLIAAIKELKKELDQLKGK